MIFETILLSSILLGDTVTEKVQNMDEVVIVSAPGRKQKRSVKGQVASIDEHLSELSNVNLVRRGAYAWEPVVNNMQTERLSTTIDGMKIFYACTDKMDPVTSYVESGNLQSISLNSGLDGNPQATGNIGGSLDLRLRKVGFDGNPFHLNMSVGHELNGHLQVYGADAAFSNHNFYTNLGAFYRHAGNYKAGGQEKVEFSQFQKLNAFANLGYRFPSTGGDGKGANILEGTVIFDCATNVGYPALNMDVSKAEAFITSLSYKHVFTSAQWETKLYYNHITHVMDDTHRPDVQIHMDMPGKSWTTGLYSLLSFSIPKHNVQLNYEIYYNRLFADMTMYPGGAAPMYMVTWPDVGTLNTGFAASDNITLDSHQRIRLSAKFAWQQQRLNNEEGYHALRVFFPGMLSNYHQTTGRIAASYQLSMGNSLWSFGAGWGSRAPTVTEAYGYYLNNTFDQYDYIGNPSLKNEAAVELNTSFNFSLSHSLKFKIDGNLFLFSNYIVGQFETRLSPMTVDAEGVKVYGNIPHATIGNITLTSNYRLSPIDLQLSLGYGFGKDTDSDPLPFIAPFSYTARIAYDYRQLRLLAEIKGNARQTQYAPKYGETLTPAYAIVNLAANYQLPIYKYQLAIRVGVENLFDKAYATYADWNKIPQKGRNIYANLTFEL